MKPTLLLLRIASAWALLLSQGADAASDHLICKSLSKETFRLQSKYKKSLIAPYIRHMQQESERSDWEVTVLDASGKRLPASNSVHVHFGNREPYSLERVCASLAVIQGIPSRSPWMVLIDGEWKSRLTHFPSAPLKNLDDEIRENRPTPYAQQARDKGYTAAKAELLARMGRQWVLEYALSRPDAQGQSPSNAIVSAVFQSTSDDDGQTWSEPVITRQGLIFDVGYPLYDSCVLARPESLNGRPLDYPFPERCKALSRP